MHSNPYHSPVTGVPHKTQRTRWLVRLGVVCLGLAVICILLSIAIMYFSFHTIAEAATAPRPEDIARGIAWSRISAYAAAPCGLVGVSALVAGLLIRRPVD